MASMVRISRARNALIPLESMLQNWRQRDNAILRSKTSADIDAWLRDAVNSLLGGFARGIAADRAAVEAAINEPWSNGQTEGQITKLKLLKRQMYGRANLDLLRARLCAA